MFSWLIITIWFEFDGRLAMKHFIDHSASICDKAISNAITKAKIKYPEQNIKAVKCNDPVTWFKKYKLDKWDQVKDKE